MRYAIIPVTPFEQNCTVFWCEKTRQAAVIDPGGDIERILEFLDIKPAWKDGMVGLMQLITLSHVNQALTKRFIW